MIRKPVRSRRGFVYLVLLTMGLLAVSFHGAAAAGGDDGYADMKGYWDVRFSDGKNGYMHVTRHTLFCRERRAWVGKLVIPRGIRLAEDKTADLTITITLAPDNIAAGGLLFQTALGKYDLALRSGDALVMIEGGEAVGTVRGYGKLLSPYMLEGSFGVYPEGWQIDGATDFVALLRR